MSDIGVVKDQDQPTKPQLPNVVGNPAAPNNIGGQRANTPAQNPPNVNGGPATFSNLTQGISDLVTAKTSEFSATMDAYKANTQIDTTSAQQVSNLTAQSIEALTNIQKAESLPGGAGGDIATIIGLFDGRYNAQKQKSQIEINQLKASQITATAAALKSANNMLPEILGKASEAQKVILDAQNQANTLFLKGVEIDQGQQKLKLEAARTRIEMSQENRAAIDFKIKGMTTAQLEAELPRAQAGKGPLAGMGGIIEDRLTAEKMSIASLEKASLELKKGNREEANASLSDFVQHLPHDLAAQAIAKAQTSGAPFVEFPTEAKGPDGKPQTIQIPFDIAQQGLTKSIAIDQQTTSALAADYSQRLNLIPNIQNLVKSSSAMASMDPQATQILASAQNVLRNLNPRDPNSVRQTATVVEGLLKQKDAIVKQNAEKFSTKTAQAAVISFGSSGKFDAQGATAVTADSVGTPALLRSARYSSAWDLLNTEAATVISQQHIVNAPAPTDGVDAATLLAQLMQKPSGKETLNRISTNILADPIKIKPIVASVKGNIELRSTVGVINQLAAQKSPGQPLWNEISKHPELVRNDKGQFDEGKLFELLEKQSLVARANGVKDANFSHDFLLGLRNYGMNADNQSSSDPSYTVQDHALEAALFGGDPTHPILNGLHFRYRQTAENAHAQMMQRVQEDLSGQTQRKAVEDSRMIDAYNDGQTLDGLPLPGKQKQLLNKYGVDLNTVTSATGTGLTAQQLRMIYGPR